MTSCRRRCPGFTGNCSGCRGSTVAESQHMPIPGPIAGESPLVLYGSSISYFTGKLENYFRLRGIPYQFRSMQFPAMKHTWSRKWG